nr:hypothetical protein [Tanacetum cinerariifolium]
TNAAFDFSSFSGSSISVDYLVRRDSLGGYELYDIRLVSGGAGDNPHRHFGTLSSVDIFGFGVIKPDGNSKEIFFHHVDATFDLSSVSGSAVSVDFLVKECIQGGIQACDVRLVSGDAGDNVREFPIGNNCGGSGSGCYNCGEGDHYAKDFPTGGYENTKEEINREEITGKHMIVHVGNNSTVDDVLEYDMLFEIEGVGPILKFKEVEVDADKKKRLA